MRDVERCLSDHRHLENLTSLRLRPSISLLQDLEAESFLACRRVDLRYKDSTMLHVQTIDSLDLPELAPYRTMRRQMEHREQGIFVAEGEKVVRRLLESNFTVVSVMLPEKWLREFEPLIRS